LRIVQTPGEDMIRRYLTVRDGILSVRVTGRLF
jgi:hypothetical protein